MVPGLFIMIIYGSDYDDYNDYNDDYDDDDDSSMPVARVLAAASMGPQLLLPYYSPLLKSALRIHYSLLSVSRDFSFSSHVSNC